MSLTNHILHVEEVGRISGEVILDTLLVTDVDHDVTEYAQCASLANGNGESALKHILYDASGLEAYGFTSCIGTRNDEDALLRGESDVERHYFLALLLQ